MKKEFKPIAMRCTQEQFEDVKEELIENEIIVYCDNMHYHYLTNDYNQEKIVRFTLCNNEEYNDRTTYEQWDKNIFLEACGIETKYKISKETILKYKMKDEFPEMFEVRLEVGKWYNVKKIHTGSTGFCGIGQFTNEESKHGNSVGYNLKQANGEIWTTNGDISEATNQEVENALINEAKKRGFKEGVYGNNSLVINGKFKDYLLEKGYFEYLDSTLFWSLGDDEESRWAIFKDGIWAEIIQTITKEEAEKKLNCKIV